MSRRDRRDKTRLKSKRLQYIDRKSIMFMFGGPKKSGYSLTHNLLSFTDYLAQKSGFESLHDIKMLQ